jgi:hypothetical protein
MPPAIETEEVVEAVAAIDAIFPEDYPEEYKRVFLQEATRHLILGRESVS